MIFYFSGTGNSEGIAKMLAERLGDQAVSIIDRNPADYCLTEADSLGFVFPIYGYVAPAVMLRFAAGIRANGAYTYAVPTFSNCAGCTLEHFSQTIPLDGGFGIKMPDNMPVFDKIVETRETAIVKLKAAAVRFEEVVDKIRNKEHGFDILKGENAEENTRVMGLSFLEKPRHQTTEYHIHEDRCVGCGLCAEVCPARAIEMTPEGQPRWVKKDCYICMACLNHCPTEAIEYGPYSEGKYRYLFKGFDLSNY